MIISSTHPLADSARVGAALGAMDRALLALRRIDLGWPERCMLARRILEDAFERDKKARQSKDVIRDLGVQDDYPSCATCNDEGFVYDRFATGPLALDDIRDRPCPECGGGS